jgi:DNA primase
VKRRTLYALNWAKADVIKSNEVVVCEGYTDVIGCFVAGVPRAVATCGTALSEEHFKLLSNFAKRIVLAFDADQAGQSAMGRVYEWEQKFETSVAVASFPPGDDPGELSQRDPEKLRQAIADAVPYLQFRVNRLLSSADLKNAEGRARGAEAALSAVAEHPDPLVRDQYVMMLSDRTAITAQLLRNQLSAVLAQPASERKFFANANATAPSRPVVKEVSSGSRPGLEALRLAVHRPDLVVDRLEAVLFKDPIQREAFLALSNADNLAAAIESVAEESPAVASLLYRLDVEEPTPVDNPALDPADPVMAQLVREGVRRELSLRQGAVRRGEEEIATIAQETAEVRRYLAELDDPINGRAATDWLVAWLMVTSQEDE